MVGRLGHGRSRAGGPRGRCTAGPGRSTGWVGLRGRLHGRGERCSAAARPTLQLGGRRARTAASPPRWTRPGDRDGARLAAVGERDGAQSAVDGVDERAGPSGDQRGGRGRPGRHQRRSRPIPAGSGEQAAVGARTRSGLTVDDHAGAPTTPVASGSSRPCRIRPSGPTRTSDIIGAGGPHARCVVPGGGRADRQLARISRRLRRDDVASPASRRNRIRAPEPAREESRSLA